MDPRQSILLTIAIMVPSVLLAMNRTRPLLAWVCVTLFVQVADTTTLTNLPAGRIVGLLYLPFAVATARQWLATVPVRAWLLNFLYLVALGIAWGFIWPWPDITANRPFSLGPNGRTIIFLGRMLSDVSLTLFVARELCRPGGIQFLRTALITGSTLTALFGLAAVLLKFDFYHAITGLSVDFIDYKRARGLSYEPRGLGLACVYGIILLIPYRPPSPSRILLLGINLLGLVVSGSTSALALLLAGLLAVGLVSSTRQRMALIGGCVLVGICLMGTARMMSTRFEIYTDNLMYRLDPAEKLGYARAETWGERIAYRLDVFDASALLFMTSEPMYFFTGCGPGLVSLPGSYHVPPGLYSQIWTDDVGINSLPTHGPLLEASNGGIVSLALWLLQLAVCWKAIKRLSGRPALPGCSNPWRLARRMFCLAVVFYIVQVSISPVWAVLQAVGWAAVAGVSQADMPVITRRRVQPVGSYLTRRMSTAGTRKATG